MSESDILTTSQRETAANEDEEFRNILQQLRPFIVELTDTYSIQNCNGWIEKFMRCGPEEKPTRNKYVQLMCRQLARRVLKEPFTLEPPSGKLIDLDALGRSSDKLSCSISSLSQMSNKRDEAIKTWFNTAEENNFSGTVRKMDKTPQVRRSQSETQLHETNYDTPISMTEFAMMSEFHEDVCCKSVGSYQGAIKPELAPLEDRAVNLIRRLGEIRTQNVALSSELKAVKEEALKRKRANAARMDEYEDLILNLQNKLHETATHAHTGAHPGPCAADMACRGALERTNAQLRDARVLADNLRATLRNMERKLVEVGEKKNNEIEELELIHKLEISQMQSKQNEDVLNLTKEYTNKLEQMQVHFEESSRTLEEKLNEQIMEVGKTHMDAMKEKDKCLREREVEIVRLEDIIQEQCTKLQSAVCRLMAKCSNEEVMSRMRTLEKQVASVERSKRKTTKAYEAKIKSMQKEKGVMQVVTEFGNAAVSFRVSQYLEQAYILPYHEMLKDRSQIFREMSHAKQKEVKQAVDYLESKYKDIIADIQGSAIKRRLQDQKSIENLLNLACRMPFVHELNHYSGRSSYLLRELLRGAECAETEGGDCGGEGEKAIQGAFSQSAANHGTEGFLEPTQCKSA